MKKPWKTIGIIFIIGVTGFLGLVLFLYAVKDMDKIGEAAWDIGSVAVLDILIVLGTFLLRSFWEYRWKRKNQVEMHQFDRVLQYDESGYTIPMIFLIGFIMMLVAMIRDWEEYIEALRAWEEPLKLLWPWMFGLVALVWLYYLSRKKIFYSDYGLKILPLFGRAREIAWSEFVGMEVSDNLYRCILISEFKTYTLMADPWRDGWDDFIGTVLTVMEKRYGIE